MLVDDNICFTFQCTVKIMEGIVLPLVISIVVIASFIRHVYHLPGVTHWTEIYFLQTIGTSRVLYLNSKIGTP